MGRLNYRTPNHQFNSTIPKSWLGGSAFKTHFLNSLTLIFPIGEKFFIRSIKKVQDQLDDKRLKEDVKLFVKQELEHSKEHEKFFSVLREQGFEFDDLLSLLDKTVKNILEPIGEKKINLAVTAGLEHITALLSEISLKENFLEDAPKDLQDLFNWHAAEEIEHRAVAFDVLQKVAPEFSLRIFGILYAYFVLTLLSSVFTCILLHQDRKLFNLETLNDFFQMFFIKEKLFFKAIAIFARYLSPDFHPLNEDLDHLANGVLDSTLGQVA